MQNKQPKDYSKEDGFMCGDEETEIIVVYLLFAAVIAGLVAAYLYFN